VENVVDVPVVQRQRYQAALKELLENAEPIEDVGSNWAGYRKHIRMHMLKDDWDALKTWPTMQLTAYTYSRHRPIMQEVTDLDPQFLKALYKFDPENGTVVHQAHALTMLKSWAGIDATKLDNVAEFGAGYGEMPLLMWRTGYRGIYNIFDFLEFSLLQRWYLTGEKVDIYNHRFHSKLEEWDKAVREPDLLIAINSLSETDLFMRSHILGCKPRAVLIRYGAGIWAKVNNQKYFNALADEFDHHKIVGTYEPTQRFFIGWNK